MSAHLTLRARSLAVIALVVAHSLLLGPEEAPAGGGSDWQWPVAGARTVVEPFVAPAHDYGPGHRGIDIAAPDGEVRAPASGIVAFVGTVVDRPLITIDHGGGLVTTFEPVASRLRAGDAVTAGDAIGTVASGGHAPSGAVHMGLRVHGVYVDPMAMFGPVERAILLPCCAPL
ncbi:M23 family metallopeptidase [Microbacterium sp. M28]|uniref:murein hydrolase activator EnvC family protein n=1 Tax=Microbacterium sp. M28 TaxID=2962064 RepID=UPI0021F488CB|nr:M23 family metallopeptidase [Microbacterium sp. M28]UYO98473.1 M23 family metallopeptidase [Microbacterium sp. M28]